MRRIKYTPCEHCHKGFEEWDMVITEKDGTSYHWDCSAERDRLR